MLGIAGAFWTGLGCHPDRKDVLLRVSGCVKVAGKPLKLGWVTFYPDESRGNRSSRLPVGEITSDGTYELSTNGKAGAPPGFYKIVVAASEEPLPVKPPRNRDGTAWKPKWLIHE